MLDFFELRCVEREPYRLRCAIRWWRTLGSGRAGARTLPPKGSFENFALIWPSFNSFDKAGSDEIISNVLPPGLGALMRPNTMMQAVFLPAARRVPKSGGESTFPIFDQRIEKAGSGHAKRWRWAGIRTYGPTFHLSAFDQICRSKAWTRSSASQRPRPRVQTVRKTTVGIASSDTTPRVGRERSRNSAI
jgi:hypothetical protein